MPVHPSLDIVSKRNCAKVGLRFVLYVRGGDMASTWVLKQEEHSGAHGDPVKNVYL
jgi:hypothetical protein